MELSTRRVTGWRPDPPYRLMVHFLTIILRGVVSVGRIVVETTLENALDPSHTIRCDALVDTGAAYLTLPMLGVTDSER